MISCLLADQLLTSKQQQLQSIAAIMISHAYLYNVCACTVLFRYVTCLSKPTLLKKTQQYLQV